MRDDPAEVGDERRRSYARLIDLAVSVEFPALMLDSGDREELGRYVQKLTVEVYWHDDTQECITLGHLECFLFDAVGADRDEESMWPEADYEGDPCEFYEFLFQHGVEWMRNGLMHYLQPDDYEDDEEELTDICNVLCVSRGWWACRPDVLVHVIGRLRRTLGFSFACVDAKYVGANAHHKDGAPSPKPMELPLPFRKAVWGETLDPERLVEDARDRFFWVAPLWGDAEDLIPQVGDEELVQLQVMS